MSADPRPASPGSLRRLAAAIERERASARDAAADCARAFYRPAAERAALAAAARRAADRCASMAALLNRRGNGSAGLGIARAAFSAELAAFDAARAAFYAAAERSPLLTEGGRS